MLGQTMSGKMLLALAAITMCAQALPTEMLDSRQTTGSCASGLHIIVARASGEPQGEGIIGQVAQQIISEVPGSDSVAVVYPASVYNYQSSESQGVVAMTNMITQYVQSCPNAKIALLGYSQGAEVIGDTLVGSSPYGFYGSANGLAAQYRKNIVAVIQMGDPSHVPFLSFDVGTSTHNGIFARTNSASYTSDGFASKIQSYCDSGDEFCDSGNSLQVHLSYVQEYGTAATNFVVSKAR